MSTTFRTDFRTALAAVLASFHTANPTLVQRTYGARPPSFHPPLAYVGLINEPRIDFTSGVRNRLVRAQIVLVQGLYDNEEASVRLDVLADAFLDHLTANLHAINGRSVITPTATEDVELVMPSAADRPSIPYAATLVTVESDIAEGRL